MGTHGDRILVTLAVVVFGLLAFAGSVLAIDSFRQRRALNALTSPPSWVLQDSRVLDASLYDVWSIPACSTSPCIRVVCFVSRSADVEAVQQAWGLGRGARSTMSADVDTIIISVGDRAVLNAVPSNVPVAHVREPEEFSALTGVRVLPFTLATTGDGHVLTAGPGIPDLAFLEATVARFRRDGATATTEFRRATTDMIPTLRPIEELFQPQGLPQ